MKHARVDYNRIQDPTGYIPKDEPVFLIRGQDVCGPKVLRFYAMCAREEGASEELVNATLMQAENMVAWQHKHASKVPDLPD